MNKKIILTELVGHWQYQPTFYDYGIKSKIKNNEANLHTQKKKKNDFQKFHLMPITIEFKQKPNLFSHYNHDANSMTKNLTEKQEKGPWIAMEFSKDLNIEP